jgi:hypothetical protein
MIVMQQVECTNNLKNSPEIQLAKVKDSNMGEDPRNQLLASLMQQN